LLDFGIHLGSRNTPNCARWIVGKKKKKKKNWPWIAVQTKATTTPSGRPLQSCLWIHKNTQTFYSYLSSSSYSVSIIPHFFFFVSLSTYLALVCAQWLLMLLLPIPPIFSVFTVPRKTFPEQPGKRRK
jgi:hypothetical protein